MFARSQFKIVRIHEACKIRRLSSIFLKERVSPIFMLKTEQKNLEIYLIVSNFNFSHFDPANEIANQPAWQYFGCVIVY